jgi:hypothetical protein
VPTNEIMLHINIGPSALAMGLLIPMTLDAGFDVCLIGKPGPREDTTFGISNSAPGGSLSFCEVNWFEGPSEVDELPAEVQTRIQSDEPLLITASMRAAIGARVDFIVEILRRRPSSAAETIVLACENAPHADYEKVREACTQYGALMLSTVVNRMCLELPRDLEKRRRVSAHPLGEWLIGVPEQTPGAHASKILAALASVEGFEAVNDIVARHDRKLWMVNGAHQALALMARRGNADYRLEASDDLRHALSYPPTKLCLENLHSAMNAALHMRYPTLTGSVEYGRKHVQAYAEHPDSVARVLKAFRRLELMPFLHALDDRIAAPARVCHEHGMSVEPFSHVLDVFLELVANVDAFEDNIQVRRTLISVESDIALVERFREILTPWADDTIEKQTGHFARLLADHREAFEP